VNVTCQDCRSVFRVDPAKVPPNGVRARCSVCGAIMRISVGATTPLTNPMMTPRTATPVRTPAVTAATPGSLSGMRRATPSMPEIADTGTPYPSRPTPTVSTPAIAAMPTPSVARPLVPPPPPTPGQLVGTPASAAPIAALPTPTTATVSDTKRVINPFLRSDPMTRARRLARALVSDMVAYQPAKRADGLANGTLKQLFRDEIRKSYDEYVEQVGREIAESTAFFQDALNEVLAEGKRVF
jgi:predicted Zn finger-like uncharacterized protein